MLGRSQRALGGVAEACPIGMSGSPPEAPTAPHRRETVAFLYLYPPSGTTETFQERHKRQTSKLIDAPAVCCDRPARARNLRVVG